MAMLPKSRSIPISENGRINLPADMRRRLGLEGVAHVIVTEEDNGLRITTMEQSLKNVRDLARPYRPTLGLASESLINDRRQEAIREDDRTRG